MKLEAINSDKFRKFKDDVILNAINIVGGKPFLTRKSGSSEFTDCWDDSTGNDVTTTDGNRYDSCSI